MKRLLILAAVILGSWSMTAPNAEASPRGWYGRGYYQQPYGYGYYRPYGSYYRPYGGYYRPYYGYNYNYYRPYYGDRYGYRPYYGGYYYGRPGVTIRF